MIRAFDAVIFDMDGLLLDTERVALESFLEACAHFELGDRADVFHGCVGTNSARAREVIREGLGERIDPAVFWDVWNGYYHAAHARQPIRVKAGAAGLLQQLTAWQMALGVATSTRTADAQGKLEAADLAQHFAVVVGGEQVERSKPHPDIYLRVAEVLGVNPARCLAFEDSENGVRSAVSAGMTVVQVPDLVPPSADLLNLGHIVLSSLEEAHHYPFETSRWGRVTETA